MYTNEDFVQTKGVVLGQLLSTQCEFLIQFASFYENQVRLSFRQSRGHFELVFGLIFILSDYCFDINCLDIKSVHKQSKLAPVS